MEAYGEVMLEITLEAVSKRFFIVVRWGVIRVVSGILEADVEATTDREPLSTHNRQSSVIDRSGGDKP